MQQKYKFKKIQITNYYRNENKKNDFKIFLTKKLCLGLALWLKEIYKLNYQNKKILKS